MTARPLPLRALWSFSVAQLALIYFLWTPLDVPVRSLMGGQGAVFAVAMAASVLVAFLPFALANPAVGTEGKVISALVAWLVIAGAFSVVSHGGVLGPADYTGNFVFRSLVVLSALVVGHRLGATGFITPNAGKAVGAGVVLAIATMMAYALSRGVVANNYTTQGINPVGTASGDAVQTYLLAYSTPLIFFVRTNWLRAGLFVLAIGAVAMTYRRGALICALVPMAILPFLDKRRGSGRRWQVDVLAFVVVSALALAVVGFDRVFVRWIALFEGQSWALSERDLIYPILLNQILPLDLEFLFGHGIGSTVVFLNAGIGRPIFAHNDWLEVLTSVGAVGLIPFVLLHIVLARGVWGALKVNRYVGFVGVALYLQFALSNWIEGLLYAAQHGAMLMFFLGACLGWTARERAAR